MSNLVLSNQDDPSSPPSGYASTVFLPFRYVVGAKLFPDTMYAPYVSRLPVIVGGQSAEDSTVVLQNRYGSYDPALYTVYDGSWRAILPFQVLLDSTYRTTDFIVAQDVENSTIALDEKLMRPNVIVYSNGELRASTTVTVSGNSMVIAPKVGAREVLVVLMEGAIVPGGDGGVASVDSASELGHSLIAGESTDKNVLLRGLLPGSNIVLESDTTDVTIGVDVRDMKLDEGSF